MTDLDRRTEIDVASVATAFDRAARQYDLMVGLNPGYQRHLATAAATLLDSSTEAEPQVDPGLPCPLRLIDLGCGSGASTRALLRELRRRGMRAEVIGVDASTGMLAQTARRSWPDSVRFLTGRAEELGRLAARAGIAEVDGVLAAYLFRNVTDADATLAQVRRLLRPGGRLVALEYSVAGSRRARRVWTAVCRAVVDPLARVVSGHPELYRYLWRSVLGFESIDDFAARTVRAGFAEVAHRTVGGWQRDILHLVRGRRPLE